MISDADRLCHLYSGDITLERKARPIDLYCTQCIALKSSGEQLLMVYI